MTTQLLLARVGAGKTEAVQRHLRDLKRRDPLAKVWVLLSTDRQIVDFRRRFMGVTAAGVCFNVDYFNFYSLYERLLALAGNPQRCLDDAARYGLIRALLAERYHDSGGVFASIARASGFVSIVAAFLLELKQNLVDPEQFALAASTAKERELAAIYADYQRLLQVSNLVDKEGQGWLALEALQWQPRIARDVKLLIVDGYDQFNTLQAALLALLGARVDEAVITLTTVPGREATIGRRFAEALARLEETHRELGVPLKQISFVAPADERQPALKHLSDNLLLPKSSRIAAGAAVTLIEAPDPTREIGVILRRVKRLLLDGCPPDDILIALRDWSLYGGQVAAQGQIYGLPLALHYGDSLARNPAVVALRDLLALHASDFRRRDLLDTLRSPYFAVPGIDAGAVDLLERISLDFMIAGGRGAWLEGVALAAQPTSIAFDEDDASPLQVEAETAAYLWRDLDTFFAAVTPPESGTVGDYVDWLEALIGADGFDPDQFDPDETPEPSVYTLNLPACIRADTEATIIARDLAAMQQFKRVLRGLLAASDLATSLGYVRLLDWGAFARELAAAVDGATIERGAARDGRVLVTTVTDARGLPHRHVFIPGLSEGLFPQPAPEDPLLLDGERRALRESGVDLPTSAERAGDDGLFFSLIGQARESLVLSRPYTKNGESWAASHLWSAVIASFDGLVVQRLKLGAAPDDPATTHEAALAAADALNRGETPVSVDPVYWRRIRRLRDVELRRISTGRYDNYSGRLSDPALIAAIADHHDARKVWSASALNDYGTCGFRYFAGRLLKLEPLDEPEDGMDSRQLGTLYHEILEQTYSRLGGSITPDRLGEALAMLEAVADELLPSAPERLRFRASSQWTQERNVLRRKLARTIRDDFNGDSPLDKRFGGVPRETYRQEARFGAGMGDEFALDLGGETLRVRGVIDRIDRQGDRALVVDYKTGSSKIDAKEISDGRNFQMLVYLLAAQAILDADTAPDAPREVAGGVFWHIGGKELGLLHMGDAEIIDAGRDHLSRYLALIRSGDFATHANKPDGGKCAAYCDFHQLCRMSISGRGKV